MFECEVESQGDEDDGRRSASPALENLNLLVALGQTRGASGEDEREGKDRQSRGDAVDEGQDHKRAAFYGQRDERAEE